MARTTSVTPTSFRASI
uniref:Uncharacterized protein n=1 Tax=Arundo donax TaxID=35708 RepID=A0A0A9FKE5_ARUDO